MDSHRLPSRSVSKSNMPVGNPGRLSGTGYSVNVAVLGSSLPRNCSPKLETHTVPSASTMTSCGSIVFRGRSYSVMMTRVDGPVGRGSVLSEYDHVGPELRLTVARYFAKSSVPAPNRRVRSGALTRNCGCSGKLWLA